MSNNEHPQIDGYRILRVIPHPDFQPSTFAFDVALVQYDPKGEKLGGEVYPIARIRLDPQPITARTITWSKLPGIGERLGKASPP